MAIIGYTINRVFIDTKSRDRNFEMIEPHVHNHYELFYLNKGSCNFFIKSHFYNLVPGSVLLIPPNTTHSVHYTSKQQSVRTVILFREEDVIFPNTQFIYDTLAERKNTYILQIPAMYQVHVEHILQNMEAEQRFNDERVSPAMLSLCLIQLIIIIKRFSQDIDASLLDELHTTNRQLSLAATFIKKNFNQKIRLNDIANASGFSPNYLSRKFKEDTGIGVHEYLTFVRLNKAAIELAHTDHTITEVALNNGFSDANYFKDAFHKAFGLSPRDYRKQDAKSALDPVVSFSEIAPVVAPAAATAEEITPGPATIK
ncbi:AraC-type DNA-binding protein [Oribacterium sp. KHPX15]|uniref:AraC family transcriptional regulator n=1 Tax=Oribacterium sp. KHPX15 TaxID=1855342 RepID=UPI00089BEFA5|nr:AraC family transcriptional regulator [Oribacterium sp. KHPX15]SEA12952.1 AraC-type DNA-binding protein [Oribacterium sp. KHPX15]